MDAAGSPHLVISVVAPNSSVKRIAFGAVGSTDMETTEHCFAIVMDHCVRWQPCTSTVDGKCSTVYVYIIWGV